MTQDLKFFGLIFVLSVTFELILPHPNNDSSHCLKNYVQWITDKVFSEKTHGLNGFDTFFSHFSTELLVFDCFCCCFHSHKAYCDVLLITNE